ncbi:MAG: hypothetical protein RIF32_24195 [Leptospirales bacterium]|jgi:hypothetical protein
MKRFSAISEIPAGGAKAVGAIPRAHWNFRGFAALALAFGLTASGLGALPPMPSMESRFAAADVVVLAHLKDTERRKFNDISENVSLRVVVETVIKNRDAEGEAVVVPAEFHLAFLVFPQTFEKHLRRPVGDGRYFVFLTRKVVVDADGQSGEVLVLTEPRPFAFLPYADSTLQALESLAAQTGESQ